MKVAYLFVSNPRTVNPKLSGSILPQLCEGRDGIEVVGMFFFDDNLYTLRAGDPLGERVMQAAATRHIPVFICESCALDRKLAAPNGEHIHTVGLVDGLHVSNYPDPFTALSGCRPDSIITI